jgi:hypothetical protein
MIVDGGHHRPRWLERNPFRLNRDFAPSICSVA